MLRYLLSDLDNTLYPSDSGLWEAIAGRIDLYMIERLRMRPEEVGETRRRYLSAFGTTLNALRHFHGVDPDEFLGFVHDIPLGNYLERDLELDVMLGQLPLRKIIFTNADASHARRVLARLGVSRHFERIIDIRALEFVNKPRGRAYLKALGLIPASPEECVLVEDSLLNLHPARTLGMTTVLVGPEETTDGVDCRIRRITELGEALMPLLGRSEGRRARHP